MGSITRNTVRDSSCCAPPWLLRYRWTFFCKLAMMSVALPFFYATLFVFYTLSAFSTPPCCYGMRRRIPQSIHPIVNISGPRTCHRHLPHVSIHTLLWPRPFLIHQGPFTLHGYNMHIGVAPLGAAYLLLTIHDTWHNYFTFIFLSSLNRDGYISNEFDTDGLCYHTCLPYC